MSTLRLGSTAPDFSAETTEGAINFHEWLGDSWGVLFSHPADYTPVCTTELGYTAKLRTQFEARNVKVLALSSDDSELNIIEILRAGCNGCLSEKTNII